MRLSLIGPVHPYRGGIAHYTTALAIALQRQGHTLQVISFKRQYPAFLYPGQSDKDPSTDAPRVQAQYLLDPLYPWTWLQAARAVGSARPDLAVLQWWTTFWGPAYALLASRLRRTVPVVYLVHNVLPHETRPWDRWAARLALGQGQAFIVQAPHEESKLRQLLPPARIHYCTHPVYQRFSDQVIPRESARRQLGLPADQPVFLFFGIVRPYKGLMLLLDALAKAGAPAHLVVAGEFWEPVEVYRRQIEVLGLGPHVTLMDHYVPNEEAHLLFSAADALLAPYVGGTQSGAAELALGYGLPAIVSDRIARGITDSNMAGLHVVPAGDAAALAQALMQLSGSLPASVALRPAQDDWGRMVGVLEAIWEERDVSR